MSNPSSPFPPNGPGLAAREAHLTTTTPTQRASSWFIFVYWFAQFANWLALLTPVVVTIELRVAQIATPAEKAAQLGIVLGIGAFASVIATPIWGYLSDRTTARIGRRKLWMIVGVIGGGIGLTIMASGPNIAVLGVGWILCQVAFNANQAVLNAVLPDAIPEFQRGKVSGLLGLSARVATLAGTFLTQYTTENPYLMFLGPWVRTVLSLGLMLAVFQDRPTDPARIRPFRWSDIGRMFWVSPRRHPDYAWAFGSRFLVFMGTSFLQTYQVYFLTDHLHVGDAVTSIIFTSTLVTAIGTVVISIVGGAWSDRVGRRKPFVLGSAVLTGIGLLIIGTATDLPQFFVGVALESLGAGLYLAVDLALVAAVLPDPQNTAKDMGVFQIANSMPQSLAPAIAPLFLVIGASGAADNYVAVFVAATVFAVIGAFFVVPIRGVR